METSEEIALHIIEQLEGVKIAMESLRAKAVVNGWDARALSIALTELETSQLWLANARPEDKNLTAGGVGRPLKERRVDEITRR